MTFFAQPCITQMRIGLVCPYNLGLGGGVQECVLASQHELSRRGHFVKIITPRSKEAQRKNLKNVILIGTGTDIKSPFSTTAQLSASTSSEEIQIVLNENKFDILHFHEPWVPMLSRQILTKSNCINIATFHAHIPDGVMSKMIERAITPYTSSILKSFHAFTAVSEAAAEYANSLSDLDIKVIPNGIDLSKYRHKRKADVTREKLVLYIGRLEKRKGVKYLIDAFARLNEPNCKLIIAGEGPYRKKLESRVIQLGLNTVEFLGYINESDKIELYRKADVFSSPAIYGESFGIVLLEAMACGTPIVAANNPGYVSVLQDRGMISLVNPKDTEQYARRLSLLLNDNYLVALWRKWASIYIKQFDYKNIIDQYERLYNDLMNAK